jgi:hypothetical protein
METSMARLNGRFAMSILTVLAFAAPFAQAQPAFKAADQLTVVDANGKKVGKVLSVANPALNEVRPTLVLVAFNINGQPTLLGVGPIILISRLRV